MVPFSFCLTVQHFQEIGENILYGMAVVGTAPLSVLLSLFRRMDVFYEEHCGLFLPAYNLLDYALDVLFHHRPMFAFDGLHFPSRGSALLFEQAILRPAVTYPAGRDFMITFVEKGLVPIIRDSKEPSTQVDTYSVPGGL